MKLGVRVSVVLVFVLDVHAATLRSAPVLSAASLSDTPSAAAPSEHDVSRANAPNIAQLLQWYTRSPGEEGVEQIQDEPHALNARVGSQAALDANIGARAQRTTLSTIPRTSTLSYANSSHISKWNALPSRTDDSYERNQEGERETEALEKRPEDQVTTTMTYTASEIPEGSPLPHRIGGPYDPKQDGKEFSLGLKERDQGQPTWPPSQAPEGSPLQHRAGGPCDSDQDARKSTLRRKEEDQNQPTWPPNQVPEGGPLPRRTAVLYAPKEDGRGSDQRMEGRSEDITTKTVTYTATYVPEGSPLWYRTGGRYHSEHNGREPSLQVKARHQDQPTWPPSHSQERGPLSYDTGRRFDSHHDGDSGVGSRVKQQLQPTWPPSHVPEGSPFPNHADAHAEQKQDREAQTWPKEKEKRWQQELGWIRPSETSDQIEPPSLLTEGSSTESSSESLPTLQSADRFPALSSGTSSPKVWTISNLPFVTVEAPCTAMLRGTWTARNAATRVTEYAKTVTSLVSADCGYCMYAETPSSSPAVDGAPTVTTRDWAIFTSVICQPYTPILPVFTGPTATSSK